MPVQINNITNNYYAAQSHPVGSEVLDFEPLIPLYYKPGLLRCHSTGGLLPSRYDFPTLQFQNRSDIRRDENVDYEPSVQSCHLMAQEVAPPLRPQMQISLASQLHPEQWHNSDPHFPNFPFQYYQQHTSPEEDRLDLSLNI